MLKQNLSTGSLVAVCTVAAILLIVAGLLYFRPSFGPGPVVQPRPFMPPGGIPQAGRQGGSTQLNRTPVGAPSR
jgi:hypothetical protein